MVMITSTPDRDALSRLDRRPLSFGDASWDADTSTAAVADTATERWSGGFGDAYDGSSYGPYSDTTVPAAPPPEPSRSQRIADYWRLYSSSPSAIMSGMTAVGVSVAELAAATGQSVDAVGRYLQAGGAQDGFGGWFDPAIAAAAAAAERRDIIATYWQANKSDPGAVRKAMDATKVSVAELAQATGQTVDQVNACLYPVVMGPMPPIGDIVTQLPSAVLAGSGTSTVTVDTAITAASTTAVTVTTTVTADTRTSTVPTATLDLAPTNPGTDVGLSGALVGPPAPIPVDPLTINAASFHAQVDALLVSDSVTQTAGWSNADGAGPVLSLAGGQHWQPSGGGTNGSGITRYDPHSLDHAYVPNMVELDAGPRDLGGGIDPTQVFASLGMQLGLDLTALDIGAQGYDVGEAGHVDGVPVTEAARAAAYARAQARGEYDASLPLYVVTGDASDMLGQSDSRMFLSVAYQERDGQMVPVGQSMNYRKSEGSENVAGVMAFLSFVTMGMTGAFSGAAAAGEVVEGAAIAAETAELAEAANVANAANAAAGFGSLGLTGEVITTVAPGLAGWGTELGMALGLTGETATTAGNFLIKFGIQTVANGGDWEAALLSAASGSLGNAATAFLESLPGMTDTMATVIGQAAGSAIIGQDPLQALLGSGLNQGLTGLTGQIPGFNNLPSLVQSAAITAMSGVLQGQDFSVSLINSALTAGLDVVARGVQAGDSNITITNGTSTNGTTTTPNTTTGAPTNANPYDGGLVFTLGAFDEATNTWATTMGDGNDGTQGTGDWSSRDYQNGWDVQSDLAPTADGSKGSDGTGIADGGGEGDGTTSTTGTTGTGGSVTVGPLTQVNAEAETPTVVDAGFTRNNDEYVNAVRVNMVGERTPVLDPPVIPDSLLPKGIQFSAISAFRDEAGTLWYVTGGADNQAYHSDFFTNGAQRVINQGLSGLHSGAITTSQYLEAQHFLMGVGAAGNANTGTNSPPIAASINVSPLANAQTSAYEFWGKVQDDAVGAGSFAAYAFGGTMKTLAGLGYDIADAVIGAYDNPSDVPTGVVKGVVNFGPELFNGAVTGVKISLNGWTLIAEKLGTDSATLTGFRESDPYHITPLFTYDNKTQAGAALLTNLGLLWAGGKYGAYSIELNTGAPGTLYSTPIPFKLVEPGATRTGAGVGELSGTRTQISANADASEVRSLVRENQSADILVQNGFKVEQNPTVSGPKNPDYRINGEIFDNYAPSTSSVRNMASEIEGKVAKGQADNIVVNLTDSSASLAELTAQLTNYPISNLKQVIVIDQSGTLTVVKLIGE